MVFAVKWYQKVSTGVYVIGRSEIGFIVKSEVSSDLDD